ncbi:amidohydrolase family protein [Clostridium butyricum]|uniref:amidohydrolase family protein n=1 Tax=Clostridium butyricum TaxID=1492 RepID=UPI003467A48D
MTLDILIKNALICTMNNDKKIFENGSIGIKDGKINFIEESDFNIEQYQADEVINADGMVVMPGFVNTHIHIFQSFLKGLGADHRLIEWLNLSALPYGEIMNPRQQYLAAQLATMEALKSGCTTLAEFFYTNQDANLAYGVIDGMKSSGIRSVFIRTFQDTGEEYGMPKCFIEPISKVVKEVDSLRQKYKEDNEAEDDMLSIWTGPDVTWSTTKQGYEGILEYCKSENVKYSMHILETEVDNAMCNKYYGVNIVEMLEEIGFLTEDFLGVHCVNLTKSDIEKFAKYNVNISHNPAANMYLGSGVAPIPEALKNGVNVSIGTDGAASNNSTDMLESLKLAAVIQKGFHRDAAIISADEVINMATRGGAKAIGKENSIGTLECGKKADIIIFNPDQLKSTPMHDPFATIVYSSGEENIDTTIVNGKIVYSKGIFRNGLDEEKLIYEIKEEIKNLKTKI